MIEREERMNAGR